MSFILGLATLIGLIILGLCLFIGLWYIGEIGSNWLDS